MNKEFNLLLLHLPIDVHPRTWICLKGAKLKSILKKLEKNVLKSTGWNRWRLSEEIANNLSCAHNTIENKLRGEGNFYPIPIILELLKFNKSQKKFLEEIKKNIEYLKVNSASSKPVKAVFRLNKNLAKILGAFMADGSLSIQVVIAAPIPSNLDKVKTKLKILGIHYSSGRAPSRNQHYLSLRKNKDNKKSLDKLIRLISSSFPVQTHYNIELTDEYKDNVRAFSKWIKEEFDVNPTFFKKKKGSWGKEMRSWRVCFSNKILARYLICFFGVEPGPKTYQACEPQNIRESRLMFRKSFTRGVLMFDGCVTKESKIELGIKSKKLFSSTKQIWDEDGIKFGESIDRKRKEWNLFTTAGNERKKLIEYFEPNTQKWKLLKWLSGDLTQSPVLHQNSSLSTKKVLKILQKIKCCDAFFLKNYFECSFSTIRIYLKILKRQSKIRLSNQPSSINNYISKNARVLLKNKIHKLLFKKIRKEFKKDKNFAKFLGIHKATFSTWRVRRSKIPVYALEEMCKVVNFDFSKVSQNIEKTDREIAETI